MVYVQDQLLKYNKHCFQRVFESVHFWGVISMFSQTLLATSQLQGASYLRHTQDYDIQHE
jgi:hypothetical protein